MNTSNSPNIKWKKDGSFVTAREIKKGEELSVDYSTYDYKYKKLTIA
jgi:SET domain-containing protein